MKIGFRELNDKEKEALWNIVLAAVEKLPEVCKLIPDFTGVLGAVVGTGSAAKTFFQSRMEHKRFYQAVEEQANKMVPESISEKDTIKILQSITDYLKTINRQNRQLSYYYVNDKASELADELYSVCRKNYLLMPFPKNDLRVFLLNLAEILLNKKYVMFLTDSSKVLADAVEGQRQTRKDVDVLGKRVDHIQKQMTVQQSSERIITLTHPIRSSEYFQGRESDLKTIRAKAAEGIIQLNGSGGIGKSEICRKLFWDYNNQPSDGVEHLGWIVLENDLQSSLNGKFPALPQSDPQNYQDDVRRMISSYGKKLLLFIDNADEIGTKDVDWLNSLPCRVIITSRTKIERIPAFEVGSLSPEICRTIYQESSEDFSPDSIPYIDEIIRLASYHTQTVDLIAKTQLESAKNAKSMLESLQKHGFALSDISEQVRSRHADNETSQRLIEHLSIVYDIAGIKDAEQLRILKLFSLLAPNMPVSRQTLKEWMTIDNLAPLNELVRKGWLQGEKDSEHSVSIHPVIAETIRYKNAPDIQSAGNMISVLKVKLYETSGKGVAAQSMVLPHCISVADALKGEKTEAFSRLLATICRILDESGDYKREMIYALRAVETAEAVFGKEHRETSANYGILARAYSLMGDIDRAYQFYEKNLELNKMLLGSDDPEIAAAYNNIATIYQARKDYDNALECFEKSIAIDEKAFGKDNLDIAITYHNIGRLLSEQQKAENAIEYFKKSLEIKKKIVGTEHIRSGTTYLEIGYAYIIMNDYDMAMSYYEKARPIYEKTYGTDHPETAALYHGIGVIYFFKEEYETAVGYLEKARDISTRLLGAEHPDTIQSCSDLANIYRKLGMSYLEKKEYDKALNHYKKSCSIYENIRGIDHADTATLYHLMGVAYFFKNEFATSVGYFEKARDIRTRLLGAEHPDTIQSCSDLANTYRRLGDAAKAVKYEAMIKH